VSFSDLFQAIQAAPLKAVAQHWNKVRGEKRLPSWRDIQPSQMAGQLKFIWAYKYNPITKLFTGRLAGNVIEGVFGKSFRGTPMSELYPASGYERFYARSLRVTCEPALFRGEGMVFHHLERIGLGERIMLPLAADGVHGDGILGATTYEMAGGALAPTASENESWFSL
jgi:hypothetical protein